MNIFMKKKIQFRMALFYPFFTLGTLATVTIFLNLKTCFAEENWLARKTQCVHRVNICKLLMTLLGAQRVDASHDVFGHRLGMSIWWNSHKRFDCYPTSGWVWMKRVRSNTAEVLMLMCQIFFFQGIRKKFWKKKGIYWRFPRKIEINDNLTWMKKK